MARKGRIKRKVVQVPENLDMVSQSLYTIGNYQRALEIRQSELNTEIEKLKNKKLAEMKPYQEKISELFEGLFIFAESHRQELTENEKHKTVEAVHGIFGWRMTPPAVSLKNVKTVLKRLKEERLDRFIRTKEEPNKEAMLAEPEVAKKIKGISIVQHEEFFVKPAEVSVEITSRADKLRKAIS